ncbi:hypothetical protein [Gemmatirosa kalamazoonensis]|uniref:hypothetical protein n=1 Tax=Gemmatirosa kalamazoonensis TaxID=861299 RepID=UPI0004ACE394|nr:hypothetical protein [Gemmatirosa kalamazoonensis]
MRHVWNVERCGSGGTSRCAGGARHGGARHGGARHGGARHGGARDVPNGRAAAGGRRRRRGA